MLDRIGARGRPWLACSLLVALLLVRALLHEPWRDELQAWSVVRASEDFADLLARTRKDFQGKAWYLCLFALDRTFGSYAAVQVFHASLAAASVLVVVRWSPFSALRKTAFALGYFAFFEYAVIARPYALGMLAVCTTCATWDAKGVRRLGLLASVAVLAASSLYGMLLAGAFVTAYVFRRRPDAPAPRNPWLRPLLFSAGLLVLGTVAYWKFQFLPKDFREEILAPFDPVRAGRSLAAVADALLPLPVPQRGFWNSSVLRELDEWGPAGARPALQAVPALLGAALFVAFAVSFARCRAALLVWLLGAGATVAFVYAIYHGYLRHHGHVFLALVAAMWLAELERTGGSDVGEVPAERLRRRLFGGVLGVQAAAGVLAASIAAFVPFSPATACARWLHDRGLEDLPVVAYPDVNGAAVAAVVGRPWYFPQGKRWGTYIIWNSARTKPVGEADVLRAAESLRDERASDVLVVTEVALRAPLPSMEVLAAFPDGVVPGESYVVYRLPARP